MHTPFAKFVIIKPTSTIPEELKDVVVYRIQFLSTTKPRKENQIVINGVAYKTFEYFYLDSYRYTSWGIYSLPPAKELQAYAGNQVILRLLLQHLKIT